MCKMKILDNSFTPFVKSASLREENNDVHPSYFQWEPVEDPPLEDWLLLLDSVERRVQRRLLKPEELDRVRSCIRERFPDEPI